jgi:hypothetical protein
MREDSAHARNHGFSSAAEIFANGACSFRIRFVCSIINSLFSPFLNECPQIREIFKGMFDGKALRRSQCMSAMFRNDKQSIVCVSAEPRGKSRLTFTFLEKQSAREDFFFSGVFVRLLRARHDCTMDPDTSAEEA